MKRCMAILVLFAAFIWVGAPGAFASRTITIDVPEAYLMAGPGADYRVICKITRSEPLTVLSRQGDWFRVRRANGMTGWLNRVALAPEDCARYADSGAETTPGPSTTGKNDSPRGGFLDSIRTGFKGGKDDTLTASAGGRGIITEDDSTTYARDWWAVQFMESIVITDDELDRFIVSGGLVQ